MKNIPGRRTAQCECPEVDKKHIESLKKKNREASVAGKIQARDENDKRWSLSQGQDYVSLNILW